MNHPILDPAIQDYINANLNQDLHSLLLKKSPFSEVTMQELVQQIQGKKIAEKKFPDLNKDKIIFPPHLNLEQTSSQITAKYKANLLTGDRFLDLTCGFGIDAFFISEKFKHTTLVEKENQLLQIVQHNWKILGKKAEFNTQTLEDFIAHNVQIFDCIYIDPARRNKDLKKVFLLQDLSPNILEIQEKLLKISNTLLIKLSPLVDIAYLVSVLQNIVKIHIVAVKNEVKEILVLQSKSSNPEIELVVVNLETSEKKITLSYPEIQQAKANFSDCLDYLYIPNNALLKSGAFNLIAEKFGLYKLHPNTHLYTSQKKCNDFPGRILEMEKINPKSIVKGEKYNIVSKNYPLQPEEIYKKYKIIAGGNQYLIFTQSIFGKIILKSQ